MTAEKPSMERFCGLLFDFSSLKLEKTLTKLYTPLLSFLGPLPPPYFVPPLKYGPLQSKYWHMILIVLSTQYQCHENGRLSTISKHTNETHKKNVNRLHHCVPQLYY